MENAIQNYKCPVCGKVYDEIEDMAKCILNCKEKENKLKAEAEKKRYELEKKDALRDLEKKYQDYIDAFTSYQNKYENDDVVNKQNRLLNDLSCLFSFI